MKRRILCSMALVALAVWALVEAPLPQAGLAAFVPPSPLLVLEAGDFHALLADWNASREKRAWLASDNFQVFSRSRLYWRLSGARDEFAAAAGFPPGMDLVDSAAGTTSVLALYDIGNLQFLYITKLPSSRALETALWKSRSSYETRNAAGISYFVRNDPASHRVVAFAAANDYLLLATREDLVSGALNLMARKPGLSVTGERWYAESVRAAGPRGALRLVMNMPGLLRTPYFRSYWIQRNVAQLRSFGAAISDLHRTPAGLREERVLLRFDSPQPAGEAAPGVSLIAADAAGLSRAWAKPDAAAALELVRRKVFAPGPAAPPPSETAPGVSSPETAGAESDLETRIDEPPLVMPDPNAIPGPVRKLIESAPLDAMFSVAVSRDVPGGVFVNTDTAVVLLSSKDWNPAATASAFAAGPLARIAVQARGRVLIVATSAELAMKLAAASPSPAEKGVTYAASFRHGDERPRFLQMMRVIDTVTAPRAGDGASGEPPFFSRNIGSLSTALSRIDSVSLAARDTGAAVFETVAYGFGK